MIKKLFLRYKSKSAHRSSEHLSYSEATQIGILYNADEFAKEIIDEMIDSLKTDEKNVEILGFELEPKENSFLFSKKDISNTGEFKNEKVSSFVNKPFDFLVSLDSSENMNYRFVLALCKSSCKIGIESNEYYELLHMALKKNGSPVESMRSVMKYLKMI
ncbi:MAG: hypothetical protein AB8B73_06525 [Ekhidna sp.]